MILHSLIQRPVRVPPVMWNPQRRLPEIQNPYSALAFSIFLCYFLFEGNRMATTQKTVMIIEDEPDAAELFAEMMRLNGYRVLKTYSGTPALALVEQERPDLIILDIMMPGVSGIDVLHYLREHPDCASIPVVVVSARATASDIAAGMAAGASVYLTKPVSYVDLKNAVDGLVHQP